LTAQSEINLSKSQVRVVSSLISSKSDGRIEDNPATTMRWEPHFKMKPESSKYLIMSDRGEDPGDKEPGKLLSISPILLFRLLSSYAGKVKKC